MVFMLFTFELQSPNEEHKYIKNVSEDFESFFFFSWSFVFYRLNLYESKNIFECFLWLIKLNAQPHAILWF